MHADARPAAWPWREDVDLQALNTFGLPGRAARFVPIASAADVSRLLAWIVKDDTAPAWDAAHRLVLGGGSNLVLQGDIDGWVLKNAIPGRRLVGEDRDAWYVEAGGGEPWHGFVRWTLAQGWPGLENLSLIPGTVGAAPIQNIGAYGLELVERFQWLDAVSLEDGRVRRFSRAECAFGYRDSVFKRAEAGRWLILRVTFRLPKAWRPVTGYADVAAELAAAGIATPDALAISDAVIAIRRRKLPDPAQVGNAGSFFKNPVVADATLQRLLAAYPAMPHHRQPAGGAKLAAGWLIEQCGWKGRGLGPVGCHAHQALVLVNLGGASGADVRRLAAAIRHDVELRFGVMLEPEPLFIGGGD